MNWQDVLKLADPVSLYAERLKKWVRSYLSFFQSMRSTPDYKEMMRVSEQEINDMIEDLEEIEVRMSKPDIEKDLLEILYDLEKIPKINYFLEDDYGSFRYQQPHRPNFEEMIERLEDLFVDADEGTI
jgi:hypothetical protein|tara:strand:- start:17 stop:400 length:384 start_codon:yes stop_codon:yes gene_type:complete